MFIFFYEACLGTHNITTFVNYALNSLVPFLDAFSNFPFYCLSIHPFLVNLKRKNDVSTLLPSTNNNVQFRSLLISSKGPTLQDFSETLYSGRRHKTLILVSSIGTLLSVNNRSYILKKQSELARSIIIFRQ